VVHILPEGQPVCGVTSLGGEIYLLRLQACNQVEVYDATSYCLQRCVTLPNFVGYNDIISCEYYQCVYVSDHCVNCVYRLQANNTTCWSVQITPTGISVNTSHNVLVTYGCVSRIREFTTHGEILREFQLHNTVIHPWYAMQTNNGQFLACHGLSNDPLNRVCILSGDGRSVVRSHGGPPSSSTGRYNQPLRLAVDTNDSVFVLDMMNERVTLLSPTLEYVREVVSPNQLKWRPSRFYLHRQQRRLYVADNQWNQMGIWTAGRVVVFSI